MSQTWDLVCDETKQKLWVGQGSGEMRTFYSGEDDVMENLKRFLVETAGKPLRLICSDIDYDCINYTDLGDSDD